MKSKLKNKKAFTLIELLVVVIIIGILSAIALPQYFKALDKARFVQVQTFVEAIYRAEHSYFLLNNEYTLNINALDVDIPNIKEASCYLGNVSGETVICHLNKNNKRFIVLEKVFQTGQEICVSYASTNFAGDDLCKSAMNTDSIHSNQATWRSYVKQGYK